METDWKRLVKKLKKKQPFFVSLDYVAVFANHIVANFSI